MSPTQRQAAAIALTALGLALAPAHAGAAEQHATLRATLVPERLGHPTAVSFALTIHTTDGSIPPALASMRIHYPAGLGLLTSGLGTATCQPARLQAQGPGGCPTNSQMGNGSAQLRFQIGPETMSENTSLALLAGPSEDGYVHLLIAATGTEPVAARVIMSTIFTEGTLQVTVPTVPSIPEGPPVAIVAMHATLGGQLTYREHAHGHTISYHPAGVTLPAHCPHGGFAFSAQLRFADATSASAHTSVPCPKR